MFKFLKDKLKGAIEKFSKKIEEETIEKKPKKEIEEEPKKEIKEVVKEEKLGEIKEEKKEGFFERLKKKVIYKRISEDKFNKVFEDLEVSLLENNVAVEVIDKIKEDMKVDIVDVDLRGKVDKLIKENLKESLEDLFELEKVDLVKEIKRKKPYVILFIGVNGSGKTTTIAKLAYLFKKNNLKCILAACDTFRAASIEQLQEHANNLGIKMIKHDYGSDPAAVAFDAIKHAEAKNCDVVLIDTAGRQHSNTNLIDEMKKVVRVAKPDLKIFVGEAITGNDCINQSVTFNKEINIDAIILSKADVDDKGGAIISVSYVTRKPILFLGTGQGYEDLEEFNKDKIIKDILGG